MGVAFIVNRGGSGAPAPKIPPDNVSNLSVTPGNQRITLKWRDPDDTIVSGVNISAWTLTAVVRKAGGYPADENDGVVVVTNSVRNQYATTGFVDNTNLTNGVTYYYQLFPVSREGAINRNVENRISGTPNEVPTGNVTGFTATAGYQSVTLKWTDPTAAFWQSTKIVRKIGGYPTDENDGTTVVNSTVRNQYATTGYTDSGLTNDTVYYYQAFPIAQDGSVNRNTANRVSATPARLVIAAVPTQSGTLTYSGSSQSPTWNNYDSAKMTLGGVTSSTNAGTFNATFTPTAMYKWSDGTTTAKTVSWTIGKAAGSLSISPTTLTLDSSNLTKTIAVTRAGDGAISAVSTNTAVATVSVSGTTITVSHVNQTTGTATITVSVAAGTNHTAPADKTCEVTAQFMPSHNKTFGSNTWAQISAVSKYIEDNNLTLAQIASTFGWNVGDTKAITFQGYGANSVRIIDFLHDNRTTGGKAGITLDLVNGFGTSTSDRKSMNSSATNSQGWTSSNMRNTHIATVQVTLPADLQNIIKPVYKLTGKGNGNTALDQTSDILWLLSEVEITGSNTNAGAGSAAGEGSQYAYYANNPVAARAKQQPSGTNYYYWLRSPKLADTKQYCRIDISGAIAANDATSALAIVSGFCI